MSILIILTKIFATLMLFGGVLGGVFYIYLAYKSPTYGTVVQVIAGVIILVPCVYGFYYLWFAP